MLDRFAESLSIESAKYKRRYGIAAAQPNEPKRWYANDPRQVYTPCLEKIVSTILNGVLIASENRWSRTFGRHLSKRPALVAMICLHTAVRQYKTTASVRRTL